MLSSLPSSRLLCHRFLSVNGKRNGTSKAPTFSLFLQILPPSSSDSVVPLWPPRPRIIPLWIRATDSFWFPSLPPYRSDVPSSLPACLYTCLLFYSCCIWTRLRLSHLEEGGRPAVSAQSELTSRPVHLFYRPSFPRLSVVILRSLWPSLLWLIALLYLPTFLHSSFNGTLRQPVRDISLCVRPSHQCNMQIVSTEASHAGN